MRTAILIFLLAQSILSSAQNYTKVSDGPVCVNDVYLYAPSVMYEDGMYKVWACRAANGDGVHFKQASSIDMLYGSSWTAALSPVNDPAAHDNTHTCDPSVILGEDGNHYLYYGSLNDAEPVATRKTRIGAAVSTDGGQSFNRLNNGEPIVDIEDEDIDDFVIGSYGIGQPAVVQLDGELYMIYTYFINGSHHNSGFRVIKADNYAFDNYSTVVDFIPFGNIGSYSIDMAYDQVKNQFVVIANDVDNNPNTSNSNINLIYFTENFEIVGMKILDDEGDPDFGEGLGLVTTANKQLLFPHFGYDLPYCFLGATYEYSDSPPPPVHVSGDMYYELYASDAICLSNKDFDVDHRIFGTESNLLSSITNESQIIDQSFFIENNLEIDYPVEFINCTFYFGAQARMDISPSIDVYFADNCVLDACGDTWQGINNYGYVNIENSSIKNAHIGILANPASVVSLSHSYLTNNLVGLKSLRGIISTFNGNTINCNNDVSFNVKQTKGLVLGGMDYYTILGGNEENLFEKLGTGIECTSAPINLYNARFSNIGQSSEYSDSKAIFMRYGNLPSYIYNIEINNCSQGIWSLATSTSVSRNRTLDVYTNAVRAEYGGSLNVQGNNAIYTKIQGIVAKNLSYANIKSNSVIASNSLQGLLRSSTVYIENNGFSEVENNYIYTNRSQAGVMCNMDAGAIIKDNTIISTASNHSRCVSINGQSDQHIECNILSGSGPGQVSLTGLALSNATNSTIGCNEFSRHEDALVFTSTSPLHTIVSNEFDGGDRGLSTDALLFIHNETNDSSPLEFLGNRWTSTYDEVDSRSSLSPDLNNFMQFVVSGLQGSEYFPDKIEADGEWFADKAGFNQTCDDNAFNISCSGDIGSNASSPIDQLNKYCEYLESQDSLSCNQKWINDYQLFSMIKDLDGNGNFKNAPCLTSFMSTIDSTTLQVFYTVDSIYNTIDSTLSTQLDDIYTENQDIRIDTSRWSSIFNQLTILEDEKVSILEESVTNLDDIIRQDTCDIASVWSDIYSEYILAQIDSTHQLDLEAMHNYASLCPETSGQAVFLARSIMSDYNDIRYDLVQDCEEVRVDQRSREVSNSASDILVYPNPTSGSFYISNMDIGRKSITIFNTTGSEVFRTDTEVTFTTIDESLNAGLYLIVIENKAIGQRKTLKFFIQ